MKMKKVLMILITLAMVFTMAGAVSAETYNETSTGNKQTVVNYTETAEAAYTIIIPSEIILQKQYDGTINGTLQVNVTNVVFNMTGWTMGGAPSSPHWTSYDILNISVTSPHGWTIWKDTLINVIEVPYTANITSYNTFQLNDGGNTMISDGASFYLHGGYMNGNTGHLYPLPAVADIELKVTDPSKITAAGEYKDTLTFNVGFEQISDS